MSDINDNENQFVTPGIGHNSAAFLETLSPEAIADELLTDRETATELLDTFKKVLIVDAASAEAATILATKIKDHGESVEAKRKGKKKPYQEQVDMIDGAYGGIVKPLSTAYDGLRAMLNTFIRRQEADAAAERARLQEEQRLREQEAQRARDAAAAAPNTFASDTERLRALKLQDEAASAGRRAEAIRPADVIRTDAGTLGGVRERQYEITDAKKLIASLYKTDQQALLEAINSIVKKKIAMFSLEAIDKNPPGEPLPGLPGVRAWIGKRAALRRR